MNFIQSIVDNPDNIVDYPIIENPQLDNLENMSLSDRVYMLYSYLMVTDSGSLDKMRLRLFKSELEFLKFTNKYSNRLSGLENKIKVNELWNKLVSEDRDKRIEGLLMTKSEIKECIDRWSKLPPSDKRDMVIKIWSKQLNS